MVQRVPERPAGGQFDSSLLSVLQQDGYAINRLLDAFETGTWTPTLTFATPGDLSVSYDTQVGRYWRVGAIVHVFIRLVATPTYTTSSGSLVLAGFPFASADLGSNHDFLIPFIHASGLTYPASKTWAIIRLDSGATTASIDGNGSGENSTSLTTTEVPSGTQQVIVSSGVYAIDMDHP